MCRDENGTRCSRNLEDFQDKPFSLVPEPGRKNSTSLMIAITATPATAPSQNARADDGHGKNCVVEWKIFPQVNAARRTAHRARSTGNLKRKDGGAEGIRTPDPHNAIVVLCQLSYDPIRSRRESRVLARIVKADFRSRRFLSRTAGQLKLDRDQAFERNSQ